MWTEIPFAQLFSAKIKRNFGLPLDIINFENIIYKRNITKGGDDMDIVEIVMNPARQRIFQYLLVNETGTVKEMRKALPDIPSASLYRRYYWTTEFSRLWRKTGFAGRSRAYTS